MKTAEKKEIDWETVAIVALVLVSAAIVGCALLSIWVGDWRWIATAGVLFFVDLLGFFVAVEAFE